MLRFTIVYDNTAWQQNLRADWGFACLVESPGRCLLFDTGASGAILMENMRRLHIDCQGVDAVVISHPHWDHTGGLQEFLQHRPVTLYLPGDCPAPPAAVETIRVTAPWEIAEGLHTTGPLAGFEQSLVVTGPKGSVVVAGCSHPGVEVILNAAARWGPVAALIGGLHAFSALELLEDLETVCPTHCTQHIDAIRRRYPDKYVQGGVGRTITLGDGQ